LVLGPVPIRYATEGRRGSGSLRLAAYCWYLGSQPSTSQIVPRLPTIVRLYPNYVEGFAGGCLERFSEDDPEEDQLFRDLWEDETQREIVIESLKADCGVRRGGLQGFEIRLGQ
jgi:hypothetical protein